MIFSLSPSLPSALSYAGLKFEISSEKGEKNERRTNRGKAIEMGATKKI